MICSKMLTSPIIDHHDDLQHPIGGDHGIGWRNLTLCCNSISPV